MSAWSGWVSIMDGWLLVDLMYYVMYFVLFSTLKLCFDLICHIFARDGHS